jgi:signal transduction histidine kinase/ActR/RegA family two-component response regulator
LPVVGFAAAIVLRLSQHERDGVSAHLMHSAQMLATAVELETGATIKTLQVLAGSERLERDDLAGFYLEAQRAARTQPSWMALFLISPEGQKLIDTTKPWSTPLSTVNEPESLRRTVETRQPTVGDLALGRDGKRWAFPIRVPILRQGAVKYVLTAVITPSALATVVNRQLPAEIWTRTVLDRHGVIVARTRDPDQYIGMPGPPSVLARMRAATEEVFKDTMIEGKAGYIAFSRVPSAGWTAAVVVPAKVVEGPMRRSILAVASAGLLLLFVSGAGAFMLSRRLTRSIASAASAADALAHGSRLHVEPAAVREMERLSQALERSGDLLDRRERERDEHLRHAEVARAEAEAANRVKDEFLAMLGHELRNPLAPIVTALDLLGRRGLIHTREFHILERQTQHLVRLVDDLLDVSRIERSKVDLEREPVELSAVVTRAVEMARPLVDRFRHRLELDVPRRGLVVHGDPMRLAQVVANLLTNAAKYTAPAGHIRVHAERQGDEVMLSVADNGRGMPPELLARVFDLFVQGPRALDRKEGGLGVGLTLVRSLVTMHGGRVEAHSEGPGRGSTFIVKLPLMAASAKPVQAAPALPDPRPSARPLRLLVVDDNLDAAELLAELLAADGHEVTTATDGTEALAVLERSVPDVMLLDIGLPGMDGYEVAARVREQLGAGAPAFVAVSGYGQASDTARSRAAGFHAHLIKPVKPGELLAALDSLGRREPQGMARSA